MSEYPTCSGRLSIPEQVDEAAADRQPFVAAAQQHLHALGIYPFRRGDGVHVDHRAAVYLPEPGRIEPAQQVLQRNPHQRFEIGQHHPRVLGIGLEEQHLVTSIRRICLPTLALIHFIGSRTGPGSADFR